MTGSHTTEASPPASAVEADPGTTEAFALLESETRLAVLLALWEEYNPHGGDNAVPFSRVFDRIEYDDPGNLRYHLEKLQGQFIRQHEERGGYELRESGLKLVRAVISGAGIEDETIPQTVIDQPCPLCHGPTTVRYRDGLVIHACSECGGPTPEETGTDGFLSAIPFPPAGVTDRTAEEIRTASWLMARHQVRALFDGLCPDCSGPVDSWLECCMDHGSADICESCGRQFASWARFQCRVCKNHSVSSPKALALFHPEVIGFYNEHGVSTRVHATDFESAKRVYRLMDAHEMTVESDSPPRVSVTASRDGETVRLTFDETVSVVAVDG